MLWGILAQDFLMLRVFKTNGDLTKDHKRTVVKFHFLFKLLGLVLQATPGAELKQSMRRMSFRSVKSGLGALPFASGLQEPAPPRGEHESQYI
eukprot:4731155-Amphidinium_carterae.2